MERPSPNEPSEPRDSVGWGLWLILFLVLVGPSLYLSLSMAYDDVRVGNLILLGVVIAAIVAGMITSTINFFLTRRADKRRKELKKSRKKKGKS